MDTQVLVHLQGKLIPRISVLRESVTLTFKGEEGPGEVIYFLNSLEDIKELGESILKVCEEEIGMMEVRQTGKKFSDMTKEEKRAAFDKWAALNS